MAQLIEGRSNNRIYLLMMAPVLGIIALCSWLLESKLHGVLVAFFEQHLDVYYPDLVGFLAMLIAIIVPLYLALRLPAKHEFGLRYEDLVIRLKRRIIFLFLAVLLILGLSAIFYQLYQNSPMADQEALEVDLGGELSGFILLRKVRLNGLPISKHATFSKDLRQQSSSMLRRYTPIAAKNNNQRPVRFVESFTSDSTRALKEKKVLLQGFVKPRLLPVAIRRAFEDDGLVMANIVYVIEDRFFDIRPYLKWSGAFLLAIALLLFIRLVLSPKIHRRKLQLAWDHQKGYSETKNVKDDIAPWA